MNDAKKEYDLILVAWNEYKSNAIIYTMIIEWVKKYKDVLKSKEDVEDILERIVFNEIDELVTDFIYGKTYLCIRLEMGL